ncbi:hypothetical protein BYI23_B010970 [Burkholderia sp. YI23]|nr:hypothetical protein BYI23_B010970 [Burkholderia sp. YI23]
MNTAHGATRRRHLTGDRNQCPACEAYFNSTAAFDAHRTGPFGQGGLPAQRRCLTLDEMQAKGMTLNVAGFWITEAKSAAAVARRKQSTPKGARRVRAAG